MIGEIQGNIDSLIDTDRITHSSIIQLLND